MISSESILVNSTFENAFILSYYDGIKEEVDMKNITIYLWYDYASDIKGEYWLKIKAKTENLLFDYLSNQIGIKDLIDNSKITLCSRLYTKYFELKNANMLEDFANIDFPENIYLGYNFLNKLNGLNLNQITYSNISINLLEKYNSGFSQNIATRINTFTIKSTNEVQDDYFYLMAA